MAADAETAEVLDGEDEDSPAEKEKKREILEKLEKNDYVLEIRASKRKSSAMWLVYRKVLDKNKNQLYVGYIQCIECKHLRAYKHSNGTTTVLKHKCVKAAIMSNTDGQGPSFPLPPLVDPTQAERKQVLNSSTVFCAKDFAAFQSVEGEGFMDLAQNLVDIASASGGKRVDVRRLLPDRTSIRHNMSEMAGQIKVELVPKLQEAIDRGTCSATTDMWTQENRKLHFLTVIVHMPDPTGEGKPKPRTAFTVQFDSDSASGENIWAQIVIEFALLGIPEEDVKKIVFVTDRGSNVVSALKGCVRLNCTAHVINTVLKTALSVKKYEVKALNEEASQIVDKVKAIVIDQNRSLPARSKFSVTKNVREGATPPSHVPMLSDFVRRYREIEKRLQKASRTMDVDIEKVKDLLQILRRLNKVMTKHKGVDLAGSVWPEVQALVSPNPADSTMVAALKEQWRESTLPMQYAFVHQECKNLVSYVRNSTINSALKNTLKPEMDVRWNTSLEMIRSIHQVYDELLAALTVRDEADRMKHIQKEMLEEFIELLEPFRRESVKLQADAEPTLQHVLLSRVALADHCKSYSDNPLTARLKERITKQMDRVFICDMYHKIANFLWPSARRLKMLTLTERLQVHSEIREKYLLQPDEDIVTPPPKKPRLESYDKYLEDDDEQGTFEDELDRYLKEPIMDDSDLIGWWQKRRDKFPRLAALAERVLHIPATSASSEREFSEAGHVYREKRLSLHPSTTSDILFVNSNADLLPKIT